MRRTDKAMTSQEEIEAFFGEAMVCRIGLCNKDEPYVVPVCFGYEHGRISIHSPTERKKVDMIRKNPRRCSGSMPELNQGPCSYPMTGV
jgi:uncharacterized protein